MMLLSHNVLAFFMVLMTSCGSVSHNNLIDVEKSSYVVEQTTNPEIDTVIVSLIEQSINSKELLSYYHFDLPDRLPLWVLLGIENSMEGKKVKCFDYQAVLTSKRKSEGSTIELVEIKRSELTIEITFKYKLEGIVFTSSFEKEKARWKMRDFNLVEQK